jgi:hypothetical protein
LLTNDVFGVLKQQSASTLWWTYFFGAMWGFGGLTFGLTMRYLGMSLGMGVALGYCAAFGTLLPPIFKCSSRTSRWPKPFRKSPRLRRAGLRCSACSFVWLELGRSVWRV